MKSNSGLCLALGAFALIPAIIPACVLLTIRSLLQRKALSRELRGENVWKIRPKTAGRKPCQCFHDKTIVAVI
jgi:hypothetical protein